MRPSFAHLTVRPIAPLKRPLHAFLQLVQRKTTCWLSVASLNDKAISEWGPVLLEIHVIVLTGENYSLKGAQWGKLLPLNVASLFSVVKK